MQSSVQQHPPAAWVQSLGTAVGGGIVPRGELVLLAQRADHVDDGVDVPGFTGVWHNGPATRVAVVVERPAITCTRDLALIAFLFQAVQCSGCTVRPDIDAPENAGWADTLIFSAQVTLEAAARFDVGDVVAAPNAATLTRVGSVNETRFSAAVSP